MEGISNYLRLRITAVAALVAAGLVLMAMSASASAIVRNISVGVRNSSKTPIQVHVCVNALSIKYEDGNTQDPCGAITHTYIIGQGDRAIIPNANPVGLIITNYNPREYWPAQRDRTLYFSARNRLFGEPYFRAQGHKVPLSDTEAVLRHVNGVDFELRRYEDDVRDGQIVKIMRIEIRKWPGCEVLCFA